MQPRNSVGCEEKGFYFVEGYLFLVNSKGKSQVPKSMSLSTGIQWCLVR